MSLEKDRKIRELEKRVRALETEQYPVGDFRRRYRTVRHRYEYVSRTRIGGWPLVHIVQGGGTGETPKFFAKGIIAIGDAAIGVLAIGGLSVGIISFGGLGLGLLSMAGVALGGLCFGGLALGGAAFGGVGIGYIAVGGLAVGYYALGGGAIGYCASDATQYCPEMLEALKEYCEPCAEALKASLQHHNR